MASQSVSSAVSEPDLSRTEDVIQPFQLEASGLRGRLVRLGPSIDRLIRRHDYPPSAAELLGETVGLAALLASTIKNDGLFSFQVQGNGPASLMVADVTADGSLRGYVRYDEDTLAQAMAAPPEERRLTDITGQGYLGLTVEPGGDSNERYQGITELSGDSLADAVRHYFRQSEQIPTGVSAAAGRERDGADGPWRATALLVQRLPEEDTPPAPASAPPRDDAWRRTMMLMAAATRAELLDPEIPPADMLYRLFHEEGVRVYTPRPVDEGCRCSRERIRHVLAQLDPREVVRQADEATFEVRCDFCGTRYTFDDGELAELRAAGHELTNGEERS